MNRIGGGDGDVRWHDQAGRHLLEVGRPGVIELRLREESGAERDPIVDLDQRAEVRRDAGMCRFEVCVREVRARGDAELSEDRARRHPRKGDRCRGEIEALVELHRPERDVDPGPEAQPRRHLIGHRGLEVHRSENVVVTRESAVERQGPLGFEAVRGEEPDSDAEFRRKPERHVRLRNGEERVVEVRFLLVDVVGEAPLHVEQRHADRGASPFDAGEAGRVEVHRGAVVARGRHAGTGASHRAGALLVNREPLGSDQSWKRRAKHQRVLHGPLHTFVSGWLLARWGMGRRTQ